jgi:hypothetical protein
MEAIKTFKVGDKTVKIYIDEDPVNPRTEYDNCDLFVLFHKRYGLGDEHNYKHGDFSGWDEMEAQIIKDHNPVIIKSVYLMDHSGISISTSDFGDRWDSGKIGFVLMSKKNAYETYMTKRITKSIREKCEKLIDASVETYNQFIGGEVYGYVIEDSNGNELESCWGFIDDINYVEKEATERAKAIIIKPKPQPVDPNQLLLSFA